jgi:16S rRNA (guanine966-N2)-methyltransferase
MRIIAGRFRRRKLLTNPGNTTRPIIDRAKVILFDRIRDWLPGARVADLFSGTGTLGLEALSRGAISCVFAERDHRAYELLRQNVNDLGAADEALCWRVDLARCSFLPKGDIAWTPYNVIFFDPPYSTAQEIGPGETWYRCLQRLSRPTLSLAGTLLILRVPKEANPVLPPAWVMREELEIASMRILVAARAAFSESEETSPEDDHMEEEPRG